MGHGFSLVTGSLGRANQAEQISRILDDQNHEVPISESAMGCQCLPIIHDD